MRALVSRYGFGAAIAVLYFYSFPYFAEIHHANELPRIYLVKAMVDDGSFAIDDGVRRWGTTVDVSPSGGHYYSNKAPGASFLAVPAYAALKGLHSLLGYGPVNLAQMTWTFRVVSGVIPTLLFLLLLWRFLARYAPRPETRRLVIAGYALGSMALTYSILFHAHQLAAVSIATAYILTVWVVENGRDRRWLLVAGFAAGCAPLVDYQAAFAGVPIAVYLIARAWQRRQPRWVVYEVLGAIPPIAALLYYHYAAFGSPFRTGYDASKTFAFHHQVGFLGIDKIRLEALFGSTLAPDNGLFFLCPMLLLALPGWYLLARRKAWWPLGLTLSVAAIYLLFISSINFWRGGWQMGPRYITAMLPFLLIPVTVAVAASEKRWPLRAGVLALIVVGIAIYYLSCSEYPHFPEYFVNPFYELTLRLLREGHAAYNLGYAVGLRGLASLLPALALLGALVVGIALPSRRHWRSAVAGLALAGVILGAYSLAGDGGRKADRGYHRIVTRDMPR